MHLRSILLCCGLLLTSSSSFAGYSSSVGGPGGGYVSSGYDSNANQQNIYQSEVRPRNNISVSVNTPAFSGYYQDTYFVPGHHHRQIGPEWINVGQGFGIPEDAVIGGGENGSLLYVCRVNFNGGTHPGKLISNGTCNISYGGREISFRNYQLLVSHRQLHWVLSSFGYVPPEAIVGGEEQGRVLYICQANYAGGQHIGKIVGRNCNIAYGGHEITLPYYNTLVL